jgi:putative endonuclease
LSVADSAVERRRRDRLGRRAEAKALWFLRLRGYRVVARRVRTPRGEIDIVARRGGTVAIVEVKARRSLAAAAEAIGPRQRRRVERAAEAFLAGRPDLAGLDVRLDAMFVVPGRLPVHLRDAWQAVEDGDRR